MSSAPLLTIGDQGVATLTLNRPAQRNRLEEGDLATLLETFRQINANRAIRAVVFTANTEGQARPVFSAGYDVGGFDAPIERIPFERVADAWAELRPITVCALNGSVYGGATDLVLGSDLIVAQLGIEWRMPAAALGLHYYPSGLRRYLARLGVSLTRQAFFTAQPLPIETLFSARAINELSRAEDLAERARELAAFAAALAPQAAQFTKQSLNELQRGEWNESALRAREAITAGSADFAEGRAAFAQRRPAAFAGE